MELTQEQISRINYLCPEDQGVFTEPWAIPSHIKEPVIYMRYTTGGMRGGGYHEDSFLRPFDTGDPEPTLIVLDYVLEELGVKLTVPLFTAINNCRVIENEDDGADYYGNRTDWGIHYILMSDVYDCINQQV